MLEAGSGCGAGLPPGPCWPGGLRSGAPGLPGAAPGVAPAWLGAGPDVCGGISPCGAPGSSAASGAPAAEVLNSTATARPPAFEIACVISSFRSSTMRASVGGTLKTMAFGEKLEHERPWSSAWRARDGHAATMASHVAGNVTAGAVTGASSWMSGAGWAGLPPRAVGGAEGWMVRSGLGDGSGGAGPPRGTVAVSVFLRRTPRGTRRRARRSRPRSSRSSRAAPPARP